MANSIAGNNLFKVFLEMLCKAEVAKWQHS